jgi:MerR family transcriptional regulator, copper efflux regulator
MDDDGTASVACTLDAGDRALRGGRWKALLTGRHLVRMARTERGVRLVFAASPGVADELRSLTALERDCCAFATWTVHERGGGLTLDVTAEGPDGVAAVQSLFPALTP